VADPEGEPFPFPDATLVLVRHGESVWITEGRFQGQGDSPLSDLGERQAALVAARLHQPLAIPQLPLPAGAPLGIWHSPLSRARQTAEAIATARPGDADVPLRPAAEFIEIAQGAWEGMPHAEVVDRYGAELTAWRRSPTTAWAPGGESLAEVRSRVRRGLRAALGELSHGFEPPTPGAMPESRVLGSSSTVGPARSQGYATGAPSSAPWAIVVAHDGVMKVLLLTLLDISLERFWSVPFALCAITAIDIRGGVPSIRAHNLADHLAPLEHEALAAAEARGDRTGAL
jgi:broad specificity phosphatase PhoE